MKIAILLFLVGAVLIIYLSNIKNKRKLFKSIGIVLGILLILYSIIILIQPDEYIIFTTSTISK